MNPYADAPRLPEGDPVDPRDLVGSAKAPVELEIGPGRGGFLVDRLIAVPEARIVGLEVRRKWASIVDQRVRARGLGMRGRVFAEDAKDALPRLLGGTLSTVYFHFPDPWWKKRHQKRRIATRELLGEVVRLLVPGGELFFQTDVGDRALAFEVLVAGEPMLAPWSSDGARVEANPYGALSPRERRADSDGLPVVRLRYRRLATPGIGMP